MMIVRVSDGRTAHNIDFGWKGCEKEKCMPHTHTYAGGRQSGGVVGRSNVQRSPDVTCCRS